MEKLGGAVLPSSANLSDLTWDRGLILGEVMVRRMVQIQDGQKAPWAWGLDEVALRGQR